MSRIRWYGPTLVLVFAVLLVMIAGPGVARRVAHAQRDEHIQLVRQELTHNPALAELNNAFRRVAEVVEPSVVHLEVASRQSTLRRRLWDDDLLRRWFGNPERLPDWLRPDPDDDEDDKDDDYRRFDVPPAFGNGSGWVYDQQGHIITCNHVISGADVITVRFADGSERKAEIVGTDPKTDVAVIRVTDDSLHAAAIADEPVEQGDIVFAFGSPFGKEFSMSQGIVSAKGRRVGLFLRRDARGRVYNEGYENFIQTDAAINPGNSGGPLTNIRGEVVGMNSAIASRTGFSNGVGYAIPIDLIVNVAQQLIDEGKVRRGFLGIVFEELTPKMARTFGYEGTGVLVRYPVEGTPAHKAGIKSGDILTKINDITVDSGDQLRRLIARYKPGTILAVEVFRDGKTLNFDITIAEQPDELAAAAAPSGRLDADEPDPDDMELLRKLGIERISTFTEELAERSGLQFTPGVAVLAVRPHSSAHAAGLRRGHIITAIQGVAIDTAEDLVQQLDEYDLTQGVRIKVMDDKTPRFLLLELPQE